MRLFLLCLLIAFPQTTQSWDFTTFICDKWELLKSKITDFIRGSNETLTIEQEDFLTKLNETNPDDEDFVAKLKEIRKSVLEELKNNDHPDSEAIAKMIKKFTKKVIKHIRKTGDRLEDVNEKLNVSGNYYQGDMKLTKEQMNKLHPTDGSVEKRQAMAAGYGASKWSTVYYSFNANLPAHTKTVAQLAIQFWTSYTCINFAQSTTARSRINIFQGDGCYSYVGNIGTVQDLSLGVGCDSVGTAAHELGHALGFFHEQSRYDRDNSIELVAANVANGWLDQFDKETTTTNNNLGMSYDYGSIMQYSGTSASKNGQPTMRARTTQYQDTMGSDIVSFIDVSMMNTLYNCKSLCNSSPTQCANGGFPHPRDCSKCICPGGYGGNYCTERPTGCGSSLNATSTPQTFSGKVGTGVYQEQDQFVFCNWVITAPAGKKIQATIKTYTQAACTSGCVYGGMEMKWQQDQTLTGSRYCCSSDAGETVTSQSNIMPIIGFNRYGQEQFTVQYVAV